MLVGSKMLCVDSKFVMDMIESRKNSQRQIHFPNRNVVIRRTRASGYRGKEVADCFVYDAVHVEHVDGTDEEKKGEENKE